MNTSYKKDDPAKYVRGMLPLFREDIVRPILKKYGITKKEFSQLKLNETKWHALEPTEFREFAAAVDIARKRALPK
jgi:hypothetical protein